MAVKLEVLQFLLEGLHGIKPLENFEVAIGLKYPQEIVTVYSGF